MSALRLLVLAPFAPRRDATHGGSRAIAELLDRLAERHRVALLALRGRDEPPLESGLRARCELVLEIARPDRQARGRLGDLKVGFALLAGTPMWVSRWSVPAFHRAVHEVALSWRPDVVQAEYHLMAQYFGRVPRRVPRLLRQLEPGAATAGERARGRSGMGRVLSGLDRWAWHRYESRAMRQADVIVALTARDQATLASLAGDTPITVIPLGVPIPDQPADPLGRQPGTLLFIGNFVHPPNVDAAERLVHRILPLVRRDVPAAVLRVVGPDPSPALRAAATSAVTITGRVADTRVHLEDAAVVVAPLRLGGGMRVKVGEALAAGKAVVATPLAAEGLDVEDGVQLLLADTDESFAAAVVALLREPERRVALAGRARAWARQALTWDRPAAAYEALYRSLLRVQRT